MELSDLYSKIDHEISDLVNKYKDDKNLSSHQDLSSPQARSYGLLIWFLEFYGNNSRYNESITDGSDDYSCDLIFEGKDALGNRVFYVVQSKWNTAKNIAKETSRNEILKSITDFNTILAGEAKYNEKLAAKVATLNSHLKDNGEVKFIFLSLAPLQWWCR